MTAEIVVRVNEPQLVAGSFGMMVGLIVLGVILYRVWRRE